MVEICRIAVVRNEEDIIQRNIEWYINRGFPTIILDNGSTDATFDICKEYQGKGIVKLEQIPFQEHDRELSLKALSSIVKDAGFEWLLLADADEFYESPIPDDCLRTSLTQEIDTGYNVVQFHNMEFWMTEKDTSSEPDFMRRIRHYSYFDSNRYKLFPNIHGIDYWSKLGHAPIFPQGIEFKVSPKVHISRHYKFRSLHQAYQKVARIRPPQRRKDTSFHYIKFGFDPSYYIIPSDNLTEYHENGKWFIERKFDGNRMSKEEMTRYLGLGSEKELCQWFALRDK